MDKEIKNSISHRGKALLKLNKHFSNLENCVSDDGPEPKKVKLDEKEKSSQKLQ